MDSKPSKKIKRRETDGNKEKKTESQSEKREAPLSKHRPLKLEEETKLTNGSVTVSKVNSDETEHQESRSTLKKQAPAAENEANPATAVSTPIGKNEAKAVSAASTVKSEVVKPEETKEMDSVKIKKEPEEIVRRKKFSAQEVILVDSSDEEEEFDGFVDVPAEDNSVVASENAASNESTTTAVVPDKTVEKASQEQKIIAKESARKKGGKKRKRKNSTMSKKSISSSSSSSDDSSGSLSSGGSSCIGSDDSEEDSSSRSENPEQKCSKIIKKRSSEDEDDNVVKPNELSSNAEGGDDGESIVSTNSNSERLSVRPAKQLFNKPANVNDDASEIILDDEDDDYDLDEDYEEDPEVQTNNNNNNNNNINNVAAANNKSVADSLDSSSGSTSVISVLNAEQLGMPGAGSSAILVDNVGFNAQFQPTTATTAVAQFVPVNALEDGVPCDVCNQRYVDELVLEHHKLNASHFKCYYCVELTTFPSRAELTNHQTSMHGMQSSAAPIDQLTQQVQSMPVPYHPPALVNPNFSVSPVPSQPVIMEVTSKSNLAQQQQRPLRLNDQTAVNSNYSTPRTPAKRPIQPSPKNTPPPVKRRIIDDIQGSKDGVGINSSRGGESQVLNQLSKSITVMTRQNQNKKPGETNAVASILANRGITMTATATNNPTIGNRRTSQGNSMPISLNSAISITPTASPNKQPTGRSPNRGYITPPSTKTATVDLTGPDMMNRGGRGRQFSCHICDKTFPSQENLNQHMTTHRSPRRYLPYRCNQCTASFSTESDLGQHKSTFHRGRNTAGATATGNVTATDMVIPVVDLKQQHTISRLRSLGISNFIPISALGQNKGNFAIPIVTGTSGKNAPSLRSLDATNSLRIGPLKPLR